ncbi:MAG: tripartite tricarboxylate transporter substrate binding protein [Burkholderiales bacterium]|nr:tripartite tricarboxylate transporter substrate binding protein [Burkholderiales bacterium]
MKPIRIVVHFPPGGPTDMVARTIGQKLTEAWGQQVIVENRPGAGGVIGVEAVLRSPPDGYTLLFATGGSMAVAPAIGIKASYNVFTDLAPIGLLVVNPQILVVHPSVPANSVAGLVKLAKSKPGQINYASVGPGSPQHLGTEMLKHMTGIDMVHIPYKGTAPAVTDILAGHVSLMFNSMPTVLPLVKAGRLKGLAVSSAKRSPAAPDIPTVGETVPGFQYVTWYGLFAAATAPKDVIAKVNTEIVRILKEKDIGERFASQGAEPAPGTPEDLAKFMKAEYEQWRKTIAAAKLKLN